MATDSTISDLNLKPSVEGSEEIAIEISGVNYKVTPDQIKAFISALTQGDNTLTEDLEFVRAGTSKTSTLLIDDRKFILRTLEQSTGNNGEIFIDDSAIDLVLSINGTDNQLLMDAINGIEFRSEILGKGVKLNNRAVDEANVDFATDDDNLLSIGMAKENLLGGGAVDSVNDETGVVVLDGNDIETTVGSGTTIKESLDSLASGQTGGLISFTTLAILNAYTDLGNNDSYKVTNDTTAANNGYYHWSGSSYVMDESLSEGEVAIGEIEAVNGGKVYQNLSPFKSNEDTNLLLLESVLDIEIFGGDLNVEYEIRNIFTKITGVWQLKIYTVGGGLTARWTETDYVPLSGIEILDVPEYSGSGVSAKVKIDWSKLPTPTSIFTNAIISKKTYRDYRNKVEIQNFTTPVTGRSIDNFTSPFNQYSEIKDIILDCVLDIKVYGVPNYIEDYETRQFKNISGGTWSISIGETGLTTPSLGNVSTWQVLGGYTPSADIELIHLDEVASSGITADILIDWSKLPINSDIQDKVILNKDIQEQYVKPVVVSVDSALVYSKSHTETYMKSYRNEIDTTTDIYDGSYSWWCRPHSYNLNGESVLNYIGSQGDQLRSVKGTRVDFVTAFNTEHRYVTDEHNTMASLNLDSKNTLHVYTGHNQDHILRIKKETKQGFDWFIGNELQIDSFDGAPSYAQIVAFGTRILVITRTGTGNQWEFIYSDDVAETWSEPKTILIQGAPSYPKIYPLIQQTGTKFIKMYNYYQSTTAADNNRVSYSVFDIETLLMYDKEGGTQIADLNVSGVLAEDTKVLYNVQSGYNLRLLDCSGDSTSEAIFTLAELLITDSDTGTYKVIEYNLSNDSVVETEIENHGGYFGYTYIGGAYIRQGLQGETDSNLIIYTSRFDGVDWLVEKWEIVSGVKNLLSTLATSTNKLARPIPPLGAISGVGVEVFYQEYTYYNDYIDWSSRIKKIEY